jgi:hypothetical protein
MPEGFLNRGDFMEKEMNIFWEERELVILRGFIWRIGTSVKEFGEQTRIRALVHIGLGIRGVA